MFTPFRPSLPSAPARVIALAIAQILALAACAPVLPAPPTKRTATVSVPRVAPLPQTVVTQTKRGVSMTLAPVSFQTLTSQACGYGFAPGAVLVVPRGVSRATHQYLVEARYETLQVTPSDLSFLLTVRNQMDRVFRGAGAVVQFQVDGQVQGVEQTRYAEFLNALIPPRGEAQIRIAGPSIATALSGATLGVFLSDVVTEIDNAGNVRGRDNFEWYFSVRSETVSRRVEVTRRNVWVSNAAARAIIRATPGGGAEMIRRESPVCLPDAVPGH
jgi:hypothetical protein